jgi:hypothetical protein
MNFFDENQRLIFPDALQKLIDNYDAQDATLFEAVSFRHSSTPNHNYTQSPRKRTGTNESNRTKAGGYLTNSHAPLPDLAGDSETLFLRNVCDDLENQDFDLDVQIRLLEKDIAQLKNTIQEFQTQLSRPNRMIDSTPKMVRTPNSSTRPRAVTPKDMEGANLAQYYKTLYEKEKLEFEGLINALSSDKTANTRKTTLFKRAVNK